MLERTVKGWIKNSLGKLYPNCWYFMPAAGQYQIPFIPDVLGCYKGRFFAIEAKAPGKKPTKGQQITLDLIKKAGGIAVIVDSKESLQSFLVTLNQI